MTPTRAEIRALAGALLLIAAGFTLAAVGVLLDPPLAILRHLHKEQ